MAKPQPRCAPHEPQDCRRVTRAGATAWGIARTVTRRLTAAAWPPRGQLQLAWLALTPSSRGREGERTAMFQAKGGNHEYSGLRGPVLAKKKRSPRQRGDGLLSDRSGVHTAAAAVICCSCARVTTVAGERARLAGARIARRCWHCAARARRRSVWPKGWSLSSTCERAQSSWTVVLPSAVCCVRGACQTARSRACVRGGTRLQHVRTRGAAATAGSQGASTSTPAPGGPARS